MYEPGPRPPSPPPDPLTPGRDITHAHFRPGDEVIVIKGLAGRELWGDTMTIVAPSWHTPTDEDGWRLRNPRGGARTYLTAHPRYLLHLSRHCPDCLIHLRALHEHLLPRLAGATSIIDCGWYTLSDLDQLVHINDSRSSR